MYLRRDQRCWRLSGRGLRLFVLPARQNFEQHEGAQTECKKRVIDFIGASLKLREVWLIMIRCGAIYESGSALRA